MSNLLKLVDWLSFQEVIQYLQASLPNFQINEPHLLAVIQQKYLPVYFEDDLSSGLDYVELSTVNVILATIFCRENKSVECKHADLMRIAGEITYDDEKIWNIDMFDEYLQIDLEKSYPPFWVLFDPYSMMDIEQICFPVLINPHKDRSFLFPVETTTSDSNESVIKKFVSFDIDHIRDRLIFKRKEVDTLISKLNGTTASQISRPTDQASPPISTKSKNSYLKLIQALATLATDGLTGQPSVDAARVIAALKVKNITCPIGEKALSNYLSEAANLQK